MEIEGNHRWDPYFKDCIEAIDGTHVCASVTPYMASSFHGRKKYNTQNVMVVVDFNPRFTYVLSGWEGTTHDATVLRDALGHENGLRVTKVRYHSNEWGNNHVQNKELFNLMHSSLRTTIEPTFGSLKGRFKIPDDATPFFLYPTQVDMVWLVALFRIGSYMMGLMNTS
uniref:DDE Tnp4 domain-containing protein n=1 Tax=Hordeum vulgare subsp. vulgare TaxID=112509 RepID=A0A8I6XQ63_HORVV